MAISLVLAATACSFDYRHEVLPGCIRLTVLRDASASAPRHVATIVLSDGHVYRNHDDIVLHSERERYLKGTPVVLCLPENHDKRYSITRDIIGIPSEHFVRIK